MWDSLIAWSQKEFTHLPWRQRRTLYGTLVSEIMLQQTTVSTVLNHFERFLKEFPHLKSLALASEEELLIAWKGLGYYRRAKNLKAIAETVFKDHASDIPEDIDLLMKIKGIGPYTANALVAIGMDKRGLAVDANLERVLSRYYGLKSPKGPKLQKQIQQLFLEKKICFEKEVSYRALNEALMDLGRTICQANRVACELCPLKKKCAAFKAQAPLDYPMGAALVSASKAQEFSVTLVRIVVKKNDQVLCYQKQKGEWLEGQWELPTFVIATNDPLFKQYPTFPNALTVEDLPLVKTGITKYNLENRILAMDSKTFKALQSERDFVWKTIHERESNFSTATLKCLKKIKLL
jgi:A/G-specific adenine glycosylase